MTDDILGNDVGIDVDNLIGGENLTDLGQQLETDSTNPIVYQINLDRSLFSKLTSSLAIIQDICIDCDIHGGLIRSKSNDRKNVVEINLNSILGSRNLSLSQLKTKLNLFKTFEADGIQGADNTVIIESTSDNFEFSDCFSKLIIRKPIESYLENKFMDDGDFQSTIRDNCKEDNLLFSYSIDNYLKNRICQICNNFRCDAVTFEFYGNYCKLVTETKSKDNISKNSQQIALNSNLANKKCSLNNIPFVLNIQSGLKISCYRVGNDFCMFKSELVYFGIPVSIYSKTKLLDFEI